jgi:hypothetical protein
MSFLPSRNGKGPGLGLRKFLYHGGALAQYIFDGADNWRYGGRQPRIEGNEGTNKVNIDGTS